MHKSSNANSVPFSDKPECADPPDEVITKVSTLEHAVPHVIVVLFIACIEKEPDTKLTPARKTVIVHIKLSRQAAETTIELKANRVLFAVVIVTANPPGLYATNGGERSAV